jgi:adenylate kinase
MITIVTGTPGTGKTTYAKKLAKEKKATYLDVNEVIKNNNLSEEYDNELSCDVVDTDKLVKVLIEIIKKANKLGEDLIIDSHFSHYIPSKYVDKCIVLKCSNIKELRIRLHKRGYSEKKIRENVEAEIMETCFVDAKSQSHNIEVIDTSS